MAAPSNIRINPFIGDGGTTNYVDFTEVHIIPAVSPFVVRLNEVPQKKDPSNMKVVYVDETTGAPTTTALTEVAATPGAGEFRPDYSTNADGDEDWNTGLIEFSSADAGKSIQVSYTGMGTLAGVKNNRFPAWWLDRGDGSDGDFRPTGNTTISGLKQYRSVFIPAGVTVTVNKWTKIHCHGAVIIFGTLSAAGQGGAGGAGNSGAGNSGGIGHGSVGGAGGKASANMNAGGAAGGTEVNRIFVDDYNEIIYGSGGGAGGGYPDRGSGGNGGAGGGDIVLIAPSVKINGSVTAAGVSGSSGGNLSGGGGGGGGGRVMIITNIYMNKGSISVSGGGGGGNGGGNGTANGAAGNSGAIIVKELGVM